MLQYFRTFSHLFDRKRNLLSVVEFIFSIGETFYTHAHTHTLTHSHTHMHTHTYTHTLVIKTEGRE